MALYPPPAVPQFPAGYAPQPSDMNGWVQSTFGFLTNNIIFRAEQHTAQALTAATTEVVQYNTILEDPFTGWVGSPSYYWLAPYSGWYEITATTEVSTSSVSVGAMIEITGNITYEVALLPTPAFPGGCSGSYTVYLAGGSDYVQGIAYSSGTATLNSTAGRYSALEISFVSE